MAAAIHSEVPDVVAPPPGHPRYPLFDALRALSALSILLVHAALFTGVFGHASYERLVAHLDIGVTMFFLISGFLLYRPFLASRVLGAPASPLRVYARRRFLRIAPAYWVALTVLAALSAVSGVFTRNWWVYYGLLQNFPLYTPTLECSPGVITAFNCGISPTWSLAVEVIFYAALPLFALGSAWLTRRLGPRRWLAGELALLGVLAAVSILIQDARIHGALAPYLFFSPLGRGWWFGLGMGLAALSVWIEQRGASPTWLRWLSARPGLTWAAAAALYVLPALFVFTPVPSLAAATVGLTEYIGQYLLFGLVAALVILPAAFGDSEGGLPRRLLRHPILAWLGRISYGIFLWHFPIVFALARGGIFGWSPGHTFAVVVLFALPVTIACAALSYRLLERPLMKRKRAGRAERVAVPGVLGPRPGAGS